MRSISSALFSTAARYRSAAARRSTTVARSAANRRAGRRETRRHAPRPARRAPASADFGVRPIEERERGMDHDDAADVAAADRRRLGAGHDLRLGNAPAIGGTLREPRRVGFVSQREQLAAARLRPLDERSERALTRWCDAPRLRCLPDQLSAKGAHSAL